ncbi:MAG: family 16 glycosylhydrolase [Bacteroidales bacterium]|nr:family 16 glycosylhydrolase [Bacteroidales bacterium]
MRKFTVIFIILFLFQQLHAQKWALVWSDEFNTPGLVDTNKWSYEVGLLRNNEAQYYTAFRSQNVRIEDTALIIEAIKEPYNGAAYTSGSILSKYNGDWQYGKIEVRAKIPTGRGTWPAIWIMPTYSEYGYWPRSGEIDIMENVGMEPDNIYTTVHYEGTGGSGHESSGKGTAITAPYNKFISYIIEWTPDKIDWYIDALKVHTYNRNGSTDYRVWPFNKEFYLILNLAIGGTWGGQQGIDDTKFPHKLIMDYVRVYQWQPTPSPYTVTIDTCDEGGTVQNDNPLPSYPDGTTITLTAVPEINYTFSHWKNMGPNNPLQLDIHKDMTIVPVFQKDYELIENGNFCNGLRRWNNIYFYNTSINKATCSIVNNGYIINITQKGTAYWHIGDQQLGFPLTNNSTYHISFDAYCETPAQMGVTIAQNHDAYSSYNDHFFNLTTTNTNYTYDYTMTNPTDTNCRLYFGAGNFLGNVYFDNISMTKVIPSGIVNIQGNKNSLLVYPTPAAENINIDFNLSKTGNVILTIYDLEGKALNILYNKITNAGEHHLDFNFLRNEFAPGVYFLQMKTNEYTTFKKIVLQ